MDKAGGSAGSKGLTRRQALVVLGAGALVAEQALLNRPLFGSGPGPFGAELTSAANAIPVPGGYAPDGTAGRAAALPLRDVELLDSPFRDNQARNTAYLTFLDLGPHAPPVPAELRPAVVGAAVRRLGAARVRGTRAHHRAPDVRARADLRQHR